MEHHHIVPLNLGDLFSSNSYLTKQKAYNVKITNNMLFLNKVLEIIISTIQRKSRKGVIKKKITKL